jgi:hypothetical protein
MTRRCGTYDGYNDHQRAVPREEPCDECLEAAAIYARQRRRRIMLGLPLKGHDVPDVPRWAALAAGSAQVGAVLRRGWMESA